MRLLAIALAVLLCAHAHARIEPRSLSLEQWISQQEPISIQSMLANMSPSDGLPGSMIASPERYSVPYYFHWTRDSALGYLTLFHLMQKATGSQRDMYKQKLFDYVSFSALIQTRADLGEPKFYVDGTPFTGHWCRPQNDGAALRAITLMQFANWLIQNGEAAAAKQKIVPVIQKDLNFVKTVWRNTNCDLWEETQGDHFYTRVVQRRALLDGAEMAGFLEVNASELKAQAKLLGAEIQKHWDAGRGYFVTTLHRTGGIAYKTSNLDASVILAVLHGHTNDGFLNYTDSRVLKTAKKLIATFKALYPINSLPGVPGVAIGRYPEDRYAGTNFNGGNPWVLLTAAMSQYFNRASMEAQSNGDFVNARKYHELAEQFLQRVQYHAPADGVFAEQIDRHDGFMTSARDLTWSHTEVLEAFAAHRAQAKAAQASR